jgi:prepilin-type N-terminal cleavage/methylation domain-containing protein
MSSADDDGFTLIEVMVAFAILSGAIVLGFQIFGGGLRRLASVERQGDIVNAARAELSKFNLDAAANRSGVTNGVAWKIEASPINDAASGSTKAYVVRIYAGSPAIDDTVPVLETIVLAAPGSP